MDNELKLPLIALIMILALLGYDAWNFWKIDNEISSIRNELLSRERAMNELSNNKLLLTNINLGQVWLGNLPAESKGKLYKWIEDTRTFQKCKITEMGFTIRDSFLEEAGVWGDFYIIEFKTGYQVIQSNGDVKCYKFPIESKGQAPVPCEELCEEY